MTTGDTELAVLLGLTSAAGFAVSNALQHRAAGTLPGHLEGTAQVLAAVARKPTWLAAMAVATGAVTLHASALHYGAVSLVQPLMVVGVVMAVLVRAGLDLQLPAWVELRAVVVTMAALAVLVACSAPGPATAPPAYGVLAVLVLAGIGSAVMVLRSLPRLAGRPAAQAVALSASSGLMFGLTAALMKLLGSVLGDGRLPTLLVAVGLVTAGALGISMNARAYQLAPLSLAMPVINLVDVLVAVLVGVVAFGEVPGHSPLQLGLQAGALILLALGLRALADAAEGTATPAAPITEGITS